MDNNQIKIRLPSMSLSFKNYYQNLSNQSVSIALLTSNDAFWSAHEVALFLRQSESWVKKEKSQRGFPKEMLAKPLELGWRCNPAYIKNSLMSGWLAKDIKNWASSKGAVTANSRHSLLAFSS